MFIRLILIVILVPLQSCSNTPIGEKLENSFAISENQSISGDKTKVKVQKKLSETKKIKSIKKYDGEEKEKEKEKEKEMGKMINQNQNLISNKNRFSQSSTKSIKKVIFKPQPYRIILRLSGANPSAPAETVTKALRKAGVQFEVEKIERFDEASLLKDSSLKR